MIARIPASPTRRIAVSLSMALVASTVAAVPAAAFSSSWTTPKRIFASSGTPLHASAVDSGGRVHVATEDGSKGIVYLTNQSGSWKSCRLTDKNDRYPSITVSGSVVHFAFARQTSGQKGLYTAASDQPATAADDCGFALTKRYAGGAGASAIGMANGQLHVAYRTSTKKLKYMRGAPGNPDWTVKSTIDGLCCTSAPAMYFTTTGSVRIAYGDGKKKANGLKFAVRSNGKWKKSKAAGGRVKYVDLVLDHSPGVFTPPNNHPRIAYVIKGKGTYFADKSAPNAKGTWRRTFVRRMLGPTGMTYWSNRQLQFVSGNGNMGMVVSHGPIASLQWINKNGKDVKGVFMGSKLTWSRKGKGVYFSSQ